MQRIVLSVTEDKVDGRKAFLPSVNQPKQNIVFVQHLSFCANVLKERKEAEERTDIVVHAGHFLYVILSGLESADTDLS